MSVTHNAVQAGNGKQYTSLLAAQIVLCTCLKMVNFYIYGMLFLSLWKSAASSKTCTYINNFKKIFKS